MTLRARLLAFLVALPLASIGCLGLLVYAGGRAALESSLGRMFEVGAVRSLEALDRELLGLNHEAESWARLHRLQDVLTDDLDGRVTSFLVARSRERPQLWRAAVADPAGRVIAASHPEWLGGRLASLAGGAAPPQGSCRDDEERPATVVCAFPLTALFDERQTLGTLEVAWDLSGPVAHVVADNRRHAAEPLLVLVRRDGTVVWAPREHQPWVGTSLAAAGSRAAALAGEGRQGFLVEPIAGVSYLIGYARSSGATGWSVLVMERAEVAFAPVARLRLAVLGVGGVVALASVLGSLLLTGRLTRAIRELEAGARRVTAGDLSVRLAPRSEDEVGSLTRSFDQMVRELSRQREQLVDKDYVDSLIAGMNEGLLVTDDSGRIERANPALLKLAGSPAEGLAGQPAGVLFAEGDAEFRARVLEPALARGSAGGVELGLRTASGLVPVLVSAGRLPATARGPAVVCTIVDIAQRKQVEAEVRRARTAAEAMAEAKSQFLAMVSHEVRTPLNGIIGTSELLAATRLSDKQREYVDTARRSSESLLALLNDILDYSRMEAGRLALERVAFDLRECVFEAADLLSHAARQKGLELAVRVDERLPKRVVGDPGRLRQVLLNLGGNAVKFTDAGGVLVRADATPGRPSRVSFEVSDTGIGIPEEQRALVFEPFHQVDASTTRRHGGAGLGLAIVRQLVSLMGGAISVGGREGGGAAFAFDAELPPVSEDRPHATLDPAPLAGLRALVVDDNATNRMVLREMLACWSCPAEEAADGWEALDALRSAAAEARPFDLALVDFQMPEMDGAALLREIKADARLSRLPVVLLTSIPQHAEANGILRDGFAACLTKPIRQAHLLEALLDVVRETRTGAPRPHLFFRPRRGETGEPERG